MVPDIYWPEWLPSPILASKTGSAVDPQVRTPFASGRTRIRLAFDAVPVNWQMDFVMTEDQAVEFEGFYRVDTRSGTIPFAMHLNLPQGRGPYAFNFIGALPVPSEVGPPGHRMWKYSGVRLQQWLRASESDPIPEPP